jgi:hypothetical protein
MKKCILIDVVNETIEEVLIGEGISPIYEAIGCTHFECVDINRDNTIYVDGEGLLTLTPDTKFFSVEGGYHPIAGNGLIMGADHESGLSVDTTITVEYIKKVITFHTLREVQRMVVI